MEFQFIGYASLKPVLDHLDKCRSTHNTFLYLPPQEIAEKRNSWSFWLVPSAVAEKDSGPGS